MFELLCWLILAGSCSFIEITYKGYSFSSPLMVMVIYWLRRIAIQGEAKHLQSTPERESSPPTASGRPRISRLQPIQEDINT